jgi:hypothetical protein
MIQFNQIKIYPHGDILENEPISRKKIYDGRYFCHGHWDDNVSEYRRDIEIFNNDIRRGSNFMDQVFYFCGCWISSSRKGTWYCGITNKKTCRSNI